MIKAAATLSAGFHLSVYAYAARQDSGHAYASRMHGYAHGCALLPLARMGRVHGGVLLRAHARARVQQIHADGDGCAARLSGARHQWPCIHLP